MTTPIRTQPVRIEHTQEPHPWGAPLPPGHPGYRSPRQQITAAFLRWVTYIAVLAVAFAIVALAVLTITTPDHGTGSFIRSEAVEPGALEGAR